MVKRKAISEERFDLASLERVMISHKKKKKYFTKIEKKDNWFSTHLTLFLSSSP